MADISKIKLPNGDTYDLKDTTARSNIPAAATENPQMDGTAAVGSSTKYAKEDHVHPTDTSRAAANHTHAISGSNGITTSGSQITTSGTITIGLNLSKAINELEKEESNLSRNDYIISESGNEVNGSIATFEANSEEKIKKITVNVEPVQDLHGYDSPWPAGGGKNKFDLAEIGVYNADTVLTKTETGFTITNNNSYSVNAFAKTGAEYTFPVTDGTYAISISQATTKSIGVYGSTDGSSFSWIANGITVGNTSATFTVSGQIYVKFVMYVDAGATITVDKFQFESGSTPTAWSPYSNICPISGRTSANVTRTGKNVVPNTAVSRTESGVTFTVKDDGSIDVSGTATATTWLRGLTTPTERQHLKAGTYTLTGGISPSITLYIVGEYDDGTAITNASVIGGIYDNGSGRTFTLTQGASITYQMQVSNGTTTGVTIYPQIELGSTATEYEPYQGNTYDITFPTEAGTVYGGTLDATNGVLTVDRAMKVYSGYSSEGWYKSNYGYFTATKISDAINRNATPSDFQSNLFPYGNIANTTQTLGACLIWGAIRVRLADMSISLDDWNAQLAINPMQVIYTLATPIEITLSPTQIDTLLGTNNIWADCGDIDVIYTDNNSIYKRKKIGNIFSTLNSEDITNTLGYTPYNATNPNGYTSNAGTITGIEMNGVSKGTSGVVDLGTVITSHQDISGKLNTTGGTLTGSLTMPAARIANTYYGISFGRTTDAPQETILYTGIKWMSGAHMPVVHITGYAYGLQAPVEFKIGFYIYGNKIGWTGITNMGAWWPEIYLFKYHNDLGNIDCVAIGFKGACYFLQLSADVQDEMGALQYTFTDSSYWSWSFLTTAGTIPATDDGTNCVLAIYRANILNPSRVNGCTVYSNVPANAKFTDTTYESKTAVVNGTDLSLVTTGEKATWNAKTSNTDLDTLRASIAPIEDGTTASQAYAAGAYFFHNGNFCKALTSIQSGGQFTLGTNYQTTTVAAALMALQS